MSDSATTRVQTTWSGYLLARISICTAVLVTAILLVSCGSKREQQPALQITRVPPANPGGPSTLDVIEGSAQGAKPGERIVLYAYSDIWWIQPLADQPFTNILPGGTWRNSTHLGTAYAAVLVDSNYRPSSKTSSLPEVGNGVIAVVTVKGTETAPVPPKMVHFSGYDWLVRSAGSTRGGGPSDYDPENAAVDKGGFLHLRMGDHNGKWLCAEVSLTRSLGYGTYSFVVQDTAHLTPSAVVTLFTWDDIRSVDFRNELDIELSRWGNPNNLNAQYVVQPFYVPQNIARFTVPPGIVTHTFRWEPGRVVFESVQGVGTGKKRISEHTFLSGIPTLGNETVHMDLYDFHHSNRRSEQPSEVVIEKFEYLP